MEVAKGNSSNIIQNEEVEQEISKFHKDDPSSAILKSG
jgi:hypothetical protein